MIIPELNMDLCHLQCFYWWSVVAQFVEVLRYKSKVAGSISDGVRGIFHWHNPSGPTMAVGLTQPLTEMSKKVKVK